MKINKDDLESLTEHVYSRRKFLEATYGLSTMAEEVQSISMCIVDGSYRYMMLNNRHRVFMKKLMGIEVKIGMNLLDIIENIKEENFKKNLIARIKEKIEHTLKGNKFVTNEEILIKKDKIEYYRLEFTPIKSLNNKIIGVGICALNITENIYIMKQLLKMKLDMTAEERERAKFLSNMSHEMRTPMNGIIGLADIMLKGELDEKQREYIKSIKESANSLLKTIDNVLDTSRIETGRFEIVKKPFDFYNLMERLRNMFSVNENQKKIKLEYEIDNNIAEWIIGDELRLQQIIISFISNVLNLADKNKIKVHITKNKNIYHKANTLIKLKFDITYKGKEFNEQNINNIVKVSNKPQLQDTKYSEISHGFAIAKKLLKTMGGHLNINNNNFENKVIFQLPFEVLDDKIEKNEVSEKSENKCKDKVSQVKQKECNNIKILVAEDNLVNQMVISELIQINGWSKNIVKNGKEAIQALEKDSYDLILMDISMPVMDGLEAAKIIKRNKEWGDIPIIALTAHALVQDKEKFIQLGMDDYLPKPVDGDKLYSMVIKQLKLHSNISTKEVKCLNKGEFDEGFERLEKILDGNTELIIDLGQKIVDMFSKEEMNKIIYLSQNGNIEELKNIIHKLKGAISNFKLIKINNILREIKGKAICGDIKAIYELIDKINKNIQIFKEKLTEYEHKCQ
ncbi:response regulator [Clostridium ganghwense]|uniref:Stage 0 sporulation protein A homolog n=1 Tax=Clostridium ganghwense TaxID=312089 RepID=A0ABT4CRX6_9CLOT|nr:response regulator [Clostridium ganghwense]MCY6371797.1 response regulator [Clostridium ganghwense]